MGKFVIEKWQKHGSSSSTSSSTAEDMTWKHPKPRQMCKKRSQGPTASSSSWKTPRHEEEDTPGAPPSQDWKRLPLMETVATLSTVHTPRADASSAWKSLPHVDEAVMVPQTEHRLPKTMSMATSSWKRPDVETSTRESRPSQGDCALSTGQGSIGWKIPDL